MAILPPPAGLMHPIPKGTSPFVKVAIPFGASFYFVPGWTPAEGIEAADVQKMLDDCLMDAAGDGNRIALILTPDVTADNAAIGTPLCAVWHDERTEALRIDECPARVFGEAKSSATGATAAFLTVPDQEKALAEWLDRIAAISAPRSTLN